MAGRNVFIIKMFTIFFFSLIMLVSCSHSRTGPQIRSVGTSDGFAILNLGTARNFGKRAVYPSVSVLKEWIELVDKMKQLRLPKQSPLGMPEDENVLMERNNYYV